MNFRFLIADFRFGRRSVNLQSAICNLQLRGFSLIELLVALGIVALLLATGLPSFRAYQERLSLENAARDVGQFIQSARTLSLAPDSSKLASIVAYQVRLAPPSTFHLEALRADGDGFRVESTVRSLVIPGHILTTDPQQGAVIFPITSGGRPEPPSVEAIVLESTRVGGGTRAVIRIAPASGQVSIE